MVSLGLEDKVVLVTGGNRGIGSAIVGLLEELGTKVAYTYRSHSNSQHQALAIQADVTDKAAMQAVAEQVEQKLGPIYGIVANAGITRDNFFPKLTSQDWDAAINTNVKGVYNTLMPVIPKMYEQRERSCTLSGIDLTMSVSINPGATALTRTPYRAASLAKDLVRPMIAALDAA